MDYVIAFIAFWVILFIGLWIIGKIFPNDPPRRK